jgi:hypothetical protein
MLLIFNPNKTLVRDQDSTVQLPHHAAFAPSSIIHFALEIEKENYDTAKNVLNGKNIKIEERSCLG